MERLKHIGVDSFFTEKKHLLDTFDSAKQKGSDDAVKTDHGFVAENSIRNWLRSFLPKRFGVCKGYIITHDLEYAGPLEEWDVVVYDAIESPILFTREASDGDDHVERRAIPVEYVRSIVEVKSALNPKSTKEVVKKLRKLKPFLGKNESPDYSKYLCSPFICSAIFFETNVRSLSEYRKSLDNLASLFTEQAVIPFIGAFVLRSQKEPSHSGWLRPLISETPIDFPNIMEMSSKFEYQDGSHGAFGCQVWCVNEYPTFLFEFMAFLKGKKKKRAASFYGLDLGKPRGSKLFSDRESKVIHKGKIIKA
jgi:hypothetical protein